MFRCAFGCCAVVAVFDACDAGNSPMEGALDSVLRTTETCTTPWGIDLCDLFGRRQAFPFDDDVVAVGDRWSPVQIWITNADGGLPGLPLTYRDGYVPALADPMADFLSKLERVTVVVDGETSRERVITFDTDVTNVVTVADFLDGLKPEELQAAPLAAVMPTVYPLPPGDHSAWVFWTLSAEHCDGLPSAGEPLEWHCLPGEELFIREIYFSVSSL